MARAVYFLPRAQSVPTVEAGVRNASNRTRSEYRLAVFAHRTVGGCIYPPLTASRAGSTAACACRIPDPIQLPGLRGAPHTSSAVCDRRRWQRRSPCCVRREPPPHWGRDFGSPNDTRAPGRAYSPTQRSPAQSRRPNAVLAKPGSATSPRNRRYGCGSTNLATALACSPDAERRTAESIKTPRSPSHHRIADESRRWRWHRSACCHLRPKSCLPRW